MRILHIADVHLDRPFVSLPRGDAVARRRELFEAFRRCLQAAREHHVDLVTIGGDLWEEENVTADTRRSVAHELGRLGLPVVLVCGNHDPLLPGGNYARTYWPDNVHLFREDQPTEYRVGDLSVWGVSWLGGPLTASFLDRFEPPDHGRTHLLLLHGTGQEVAHLAEQSNHCPFDPGRVQERGFATCLAGHIHAGVVRPGLVYPGSPEPLGWGETGRHGYAVVEAADGRANAQLFDINTRSYEHRELDCGGAASSAAVEACLGDALDDERPEELCLRLDLVGEVEPECEINGEQLVAAHRGRYAALLIRDRTVPGYDFEVLAKQHTARGRFVRRLLDVVEDESLHETERETSRLALLAGLRALDGRRELL